MVSTVKFSGNGKGVFMLVVVSDDSITGDVVGPTVDGLIIGSHLL